MIYITLCISYIIDEKRGALNECTNQHACIERTKRKTCRASKKQNKSLTQYVLDTCLADNVDTDVDDVAHSSNRVEKMLQSQIEQLREDFERERAQLVDQIDQKTSRLLI